MDIYYVRIYVISREPSKSKRTRAPAYSRALRQLTEIVQRVVHGKLKWDFQGVRSDRDSFFSTILGQLGE